MAAAVKAERRCIDCAKSDFDRIPAMDGSVLVGYCTENRFFLTRAELYEPLEPDRSECWEPRQ